MEEFAHTNTHYGGKPLIIQKKGDPVSQFMDKIHIYDL